MDNRYGIAYYNMPFNKENDIENIMKSYIWKVDTFDNIYVSKYCPDAELICRTHLGDCIFGELYKVTKKDLFIIIKEKPELFKDLDVSILTNEYYYFVWEDWS